MTYHPGTPGILIALAHTTETVCEDFVKLRVALSPGYSPARHEALLTIYRTVRQIIPPLITFCYTYKVSISDPPLPVRTPNVSGSQSLCPFPQALEYSGSFYTLSWYI